MTTPDPFASGYRLTDGNQLNNEIANPQWSTTPTLTATPGGTALNSAKIVETVTNVTSASVPGAGVVIPQALPGRVLIVMNNSANDIRVFADGGSTIDGLDGVIGILQRAGTTSFYIAIAVNEWTQAIDSRAIGPFGAGGVLFADALGNIVADAANFHWDDATKKLTITGDFQAGGAIASGPIVSSGTLTGETAVVLEGATGGAVTIEVQPTAGTYNFNLPTTPGTAGQVLTSAGGGSSPMTWTTLSANEPVSVLAYGADNTGATDCSAAFTAANAAPSLLIPSGTYKISNNVTFTKNVTILPGALLQFGAGITVYFNAGMQADITHIFDISSNLYVIPNGGSQTGTSVTLTWTTPSTAFQVGSTIYVRDVVNSDATVGNLSWNGDWIVTASTTTSVTFTVPSYISGSPYVSGGRIWQEAVVFNQEYFAGTGYPEWWGAVANGSTDCLDAIFFCIVACPITQLGIGTYLVSTTLEMNKNGRVLQGYSYAWGATGYGQFNTSKISINDGKYTCFLLGSTTIPTNNYSQFTQGMGVIGVSFTRNQTIDTSGPQNCAGVALRGTLFARLYFVEADEHLNGFYIDGTTATTMNNCVAFRSYSSTGSGTDYMNGFNFYGNTGLTYAGANASTYLTDCKANCAYGPLQTSGSVGFVIAQAGADTFLLRPETSSCTSGLIIYGSQGTSYTYGDCDIHLIGGVFDTFREWGVRIYNTNTKAAISVVDCYAAPVAGGAATAAYGADTCGGAISFTNNQAIGTPSAIAGLLIYNSSNVSAVGNMYVDCYNGGIVLNGASNCRVTDICNNYTSATGNPAVSMTGSTKCFIAPIVNGQAGYWAEGVNMVSTGNTYNEINLTSISSAAISGGGVNKLVNNGVQITPTAPSVIGPVMFPSATAGTNVATGVMA